MKLIRTTGKKKNKRKEKGSRGIITVFVTLMMVPVVAITGVMVDVARLNLYSSQAVMAADTYGDAVLSEFDNLLKELYGLFSVTQNEDGLKAINDFADTIGYSFHPDGDGKALSGFMPYKDADVKLSYEKVDGASLSNDNVLMTQISDFMKYRIIEEVMDESGILNSLGEFDHMDNDMNATKTRTEISNKSQKALGQIDEYYQLLKKIAAYPAYLDGLENGFNSYSAKLREVVSTDEYKDYLYYIENKDEIEAALEEFGASEDDESSEDTNASDENSADNADDENDEDLAHRVELYDRYKDFDVDQYLEDLETELGAYERPLIQNSSDPIDFDHAGEIIKDLGKKAKKLQGSLKEIKEKVASLREQLPNCSEDIREGIEKEIKDLDDILKLSDEFEETWKLIEETHHDTELNNSNERTLDEEVEKLHEVAQSILNGDVPYGSYYWSKEILFSWYDFKDDKSQFYSDLQKFCEGGSSGEGDKKAGDKQVKRAQNAQEKAEKELDHDEKTSARNIPGGIAAQLKSGGSTGDVPGFSEYFSGGLSFKGVAKAGEKVLDKFLVTSYDFGMFSSRVTGIKPADEKTAQEVNMESEPSSYTDVSLTGYKMSPDINYLYGAELEYLLGGYNNSVSNLNKSRNIICGVRETMNFVSSYRIPEVNAAINGVADTAAAAVAASVVGAPAAPLVRVAVSGALRLAFASIETVGDWKELKERDKVVFLKSDMSELKSIEALEDLLGIQISGASSESKFGLSYEDYMFVLLCIFLDTNTLMSRTANLITLNMNQAKNKGKEWTTLDFKMDDTVTAVKATCKVKADFVVLPDNFAEMFYSGTGTESQIEVLENKYFGYSVIRGY